MPNVRMYYEYDGVMGLDAGETAEVGWLLNAGDFPEPLTDHTIILRGGPDRHFVEVRRTVDEGETPGFGRATFYTVRNLSSGFIFTGQNYIWFSVQ